MSRLDPAERSARGAALGEAVAGRRFPAAPTLLQQGWRDFVFAEVWSRPGLDRRARYLIALAGAALADSDADVERYAAGALRTGELTLAELREAALHLAVYAGWSRGERLDDAAERAARALGLDEQAPAPAPLRDAPWDPQVRSEDGARAFAAAMTFPCGPPASPFMEAIRNFVFGEMWGRYEGLDQRSRRWITLVGVCDSMAEVPMRTHVHAAMASGNCRPEEMQEFVLQYGVHAGWPKASAVQSIVFEMSRKVAAGLPHDG